MALRVLLADESTTIKKVMQLALQDFAVEVKAVHAGVDVLEVARGFQPDLIFADVLLQKRNGYEVIADLKGDAVLRAIPVVLMWSSFMDLDEKLAASCGADARLEKPFDVEHLRRVVIKLVPKTQSQRLAHFLEFPVDVTAPLKEEVATRAAVTTPPPKAPPSPAASTRAIPLPPPLPTPPAAQSPTSTPSWSMDSFDDISKFAAEHEALADQVPPPFEAPPNELVANFSDEPSDDEYAEFQLTNLNDDVSKLQTLTITPNDAVSGRERATGSPSTDDAEPWSHQDLSRFKLDLTPVAVEGEEFSLAVNLEDHHPENAGFVVHPELPKRDTSQLPPPPPASTPSADESSMASSFSLEDEIALSPEPIPEIELPDYEGLGDDLNEEAYEVVHRDKQSGDMPKVPQLSPEDLERIIRAQSRDIIEAVVRKIVPDLATAIIRQELERLLEENDS